MGLSQALAVAAAALAMAWSTPCGGYANAYAHARQALTREAMALSALEHALVARSEAQAVSWRRAAATVPDASIHDWIAPL
ncbi:MAG: hypothetical protein JNK94_03995 [Hyphomonadaceae bacterium]|nr:hypothetical protein [Hyphomonadaceae bacterium]MBX3510621.1 hypothetical protein [Hyphomonadaceae bacterium]